MPGGSVAPAGALPVGRIELGLLAALLFVLPLFEVPKHLLWAAWVVVSLAQCWRSRAPGSIPGGRPAGWDAIFAGFVLAAALAGVGVPGQAWRAGELGDVRVDIRGREVPVRVVKFPFVRDGKAQENV